MKVIWTAEEREIPRLKRSVEAGIVKTGAEFECPDNLANELIAQGLALKVITTKKAKAAE